MAQELQSGDNPAGIARAGKRKWGYDPSQVDAFLERAHALYDSEGARLTQQDIQDVSFDLAKDGYVIAQVDAALARLERAVVDKRTAWEISQQGRVAWKAQTESLYRQIIAHAERDEGERFKPGEPKQPSYDKKQVDSLTDQIVDKAAAALGVDGVSDEDVRALADLNAASVSNVVFTQRKGPKGYDERQVDYYLHSCVQLMSRLESYARIADYMGGDGTGNGAEAGAVASESASVPPIAGVSPTNAPAVQPLIDAQYRPEGEAAANETQLIAPTASQNSESFDALHQAEQNLFSVPAAANDAPSFAPIATVTPVSTLASAVSAQSDPMASTDSAAPQPVSDVAQPVAADAPQPVVDGAPTMQNVSSTPIEEPAPVVPAEPAVPVAPVEEATPVAPTMPEQAEPVTAAAAPEAAHVDAPVPDMPVVDAPAASAMAAGADASLAALAHMAEDAQASPAADEPSFEPHVPDLNAPVASAVEEAPAMPPSFAPGPKDALPTFEPPAIQPQSVPTAVATPAAQTAPATRVAASTPITPVAPAVQESAVATPVMPVAQMAGAPVQMPQEASAPQMPVQTPVVPQMPAVVQEPAVQEPSAPKPAVQPAPVQTTSVQEPSVQASPVIAEASEPVVENKPADGQAHQQRNDSDNMFPMFPDAGGNTGTVIPDLSFPTFEDLIPDSTTKKEQ